jgi:hypothetical protein
MGKLSGTVLILAGVALAGYTLSSRDDAGTEVATARVSADAEAPAAPAAHAPGAGPSPGPAKAVATPASAVAPAQSAPAAQEGSELPTPPAPPAPADPPASAAPAALSPPPPTPLQRSRPATTPAVGLAEAPPRVPVGEDKATAGPPLDRPALIREIQRELQRIGCYRGHVNGVWTPSARQAMKALNDRVNASLPVDQPDPVLLAMAQSQEAETCAASCPADQARAADGRCLPSALVADAGKRPARTAPLPANGSKKVVQPDTAAPAGPATAPPEGRMSLAGPPTDDPPRARTPLRRTARASAPHAEVAQRSRSANARHRQRQRAAQRSYFGFPGFPGWALPFSMP